MVDETDRTSTLVPKNWKNDAQSAERSEADSGTTVGNDDQFDSIDLQSSEDHPPAVRDGADSGESDSGQLLSRASIMAILSHLSLLFGVPVFIIPLLQRRHPLAVHHAKAAGLLWFLFYGALLMSFIVSGWFTPLMLLLYLPALIGIYRAIQGREAGKWGAGDLAEWLFPFPVIRE